MHEQSSESDRPWTMTFRVRGEPRCPGCCVILAGIVITFHEGWAWCPVCSDLALHAQAHLRYVLHHDVMTRSSILSHGLRFYLPKPVDGQIPNAIDEWDRLISEPEPDEQAIAAWPGFNLTQLPQSIRDRDAQPTRPFVHAIRVPFGYEIVGVTDDNRTLLAEIKSSYQSSYR